MSFKELCLDPQLLEAVEAAGFKEPTPIQAQAIPAILNGSDLRASAQTGTGKTAAFLLPALHKLTQPSSKPTGKGPRVLILVPTRELAMQVAAESIKYSRKLTKCRTICIYGGASYISQNKDLGRPHDILVATPGRLIDHMERGRVDLSRVELFILDEADRMLDMGFIGPVELVASKLPKPHQTLLFSATLVGAVMKLSNSLLTDPLQIVISSQTVKHDNIEQRVHCTHSLEHKYDILDTILNDPLVNQAIIFTSTKRQADQLAEKLADAGRNSRALHGGMNQRQRTRTIKEMREERFDILIATDVAARGLDINTITHVINFDLPRNPEDYVHRIGRTGRADRTGTALSLVSKREMPLIKGIEKFTGQRLQMEGMPQESSSPRPKHTSPYQSRRDAPRRDDSRRDSPRREEGAPRREIYGKEWPRREEGPRREGPRRDDFRRADTRRDEPRRDDSRRDGPRRDDSRQPPRFPRSRTTGAARPKFSRG